MVRNPSSMPVTGAEINEFVRRRTSVRREMTPEEIDHFLKDGARIAVLATIRSDGSSQIRPIWYEYDSGVITMWASLDTVKLRNISRDNRVSVCVHDEIWPYRGVTVFGRVEIAFRDRSDVLPRAKKIARRYIGEAGERYVELMSDDSFVILAITPQRFGSWDNTKVAPYSSRRAVTGRRSP